MLLSGKTAVVFGAGGAIGGAVARRFAEEGATVHLSGRTLAPVEAVRHDIAAKGGTASASEVDASDEAGIERYLASIDPPDVVLNAVGIPIVQGVPLVDLPLADFLAPVTAWASTQFLTSRIAGRHMLRRGSGVILTLSASPARMAIAGTSGFGVACAAIEGLTRTLAAEFGPGGVRVVCLRPHRIWETVDGPDLPMPVEEFRAFLHDMTLLKRLPTLDDVAHTAAFLASDGAAAITGAVANLTAGMSVD